MCDNGKEHINRQLKNEIKKVCTNKMKRTNQKKTSKSPFHRTPDDRNEISAFNSNLMHALVSVWMIKQWFYPRANYRQAKRGYMISASFFISVHSFEETWYNTRRVHDDDSENDVQNEAKRNLMCRCTETKMNEKKKNMRTKSDECFANQTKGERTTDWVTTRWRRKPIDKAIAELNVELFDNERAWACVCVCTLLDIQGNPWRTLNFAYATSVNETICSLEWSNWHLRNTFWHVHRSSRWQRTDAFDYESITSSVSMKNASISYRRQQSTRSY